jgi:hypothetical protein
MYIRHRDKSGGKNEKSSSGMTAAPTMDQFSSPIILWMRYTTILHINDDVDTDENDDDGANDDGRF